MIWFIIITRAPNESSQPELSLESSQVKLSRVRVFLTRYNQVESQVKSRVESQVSFT
jgi:hypothetical protein